MPQAEGAAKQFFTGRCISGGYGLVGGLSHLNRRSALSTGSPEFSALQRQKISGVFTATDVAHHCPVYGGKGPGYASRLMADGHSGKPEVGRCGCASFICNCLGGCWGFECWDRNSIPCAQFRVLGVARLERPKGQQDGASRACLKMGMRLSPAPDVTPSLPRDPWFLGSQKVPPR